MHFEFSYKDLFRSIYAWRKKNNSILSVTLSGVGKPSFSPSGISPKYQFKVYTDRIEFLEKTDWIKELGEYLICFYDAHFIRQVEIESRVVVFHPDVIIEFLFEPLPQSTASSDSSTMAFEARRQDTLLSMLQNYN